MDILGSVAKGYEPVVEALAGCGPGVAVAASVGGRRVVDVRTGDLAERSLICTWSAIKPITGACLLLLVERGRLDLEDPVVSTWPELADDRLLIRHLLSHTAGRVTVPDVPLVDWDRSIAALARQQPDWPPGRSCASTPRPSDTWWAKSSGGSTDGRSGGSCAMS